MATDRDVDIVREKIRQLTRLGRYRFTLHAEQRCAERSVRIRDVLCVLQSQFSLAPESADHWRIMGLDLDEDELTLIAEISENILIITVF